MRKKLLVTTVVAMLSIFSACGTASKVESFKPTSSVTDVSKDEGEDNDITEAVTKTPDATMAPSEESSDTPTVTKAPTPTTAPTPTPAPEFSYQKENNGIYISEILDKSVTKIVIPTEIDGLPVIGIREYAFINCTALESITIPKNVTEISSRSIFSGCKKLKEIKVSENNTVYTSRSEDGTECNAIIHVAENKLLYGCANTVIPENVKVISQYAFYESGLTRIVLPSALEQIETYAFANCKELAEVVVEGAPKFEYNAFSGTKVLTLTISKEMLDNSEWKNGIQASEITKLILLEGPKKLTKEMMSGFTNLKEVNIPASVMMIEETAFKGIPLERISVDSNNPFYTSKAEDGSECNAVIDIQYKRLVVGAKETIIPDDVIEIGNYAFYGRDMKEIIFSETMVIGKEICKNVEKLTVPYKYWSEIQTYVTKQTISELELIGEGTGDFIFSGALDRNEFMLEKIVLPEGVTGLGYAALRDCTNLKSVELPNSITGIGEHAFCGCSSLKNIKLPNGLKTISRVSFGNCSSLESIDIPESVTYIGEFAFQGCVSLKRIELPNGLKTIFRGSFAGCSSLEIIEIPDSVTRMDSSGFDGCISLTSIIIPEGVTTFGSYIFRGCSNLTSVELPDSVIQISDDAFQNCESLIFVYANEGTYASEWAKAAGFRVLAPEK